MTRDAASKINAGLISTEAERSTIPIMEEDVRLEKRPVERDRVRVTTRTELVQENVQAALRTDAVDVKRVPVNRTMEVGETAPAVRTEGRTTIVPVLEEIVVVEKRLVLKEELHITRDSTVEDVEVPVTLRKQRAVVERTGSDGRPLDDVEERSP